MTNRRKSDLKLAKTLILDELFDLLLYQKLRSISDPDLQKTLEELISIEVRHFAFWQDFFQLELPELGLGRRIKFWLIVAVCRISERRPRISRSKRLRFTESGNIWTSGKDIRRNHWAQPCAESWKTSSVTKTSS